jgi:hypothetical protein
MVPHVAARKTHQRLLKFLFVTPKRLLQQYRHLADIGDPPNMLQLTGPDGLQSVEFGELHCRIMILGGI